MKLYEIEQSIEAALNELYETVDEETGEVNADVFQKIEALNIERETKIENIACVIKNMRVDSNALKEEEEYLHKRRMAIDKKIENLVNFLTEHVGTDEKFKFTRATVAYHKSEAVNVLDESEIPMKYKAVETNVKVLKADIKKDLKAGVEVAGAELETRHSLQIK